MYEGDTPNAERRAAALSLDRDLLRELLGQEELRDLIDASALADVEADLQHLSTRTQATNRDSLHDVLRRVGDLTLTEARARVVDGLDAQGMMTTLESERRAARVRVGGEERLIDAADAGLYRDALGVAPPGGLPAAFLEDVPDPLMKLVRRYAATHGPFTTAEVRARYGVDPSAVLRELERAGSVVRGELRPGGSEREWCDPDVLRRLRRASLAVLRKEIEPADHRALAGFMPAWQGVDRHPASGAGIDRLRDVLVPLQGLALPAEVWERDVLPRRVGAYSPAWTDQLCASGELVWVGAGALGRNSGRVTLYFRDDAAALGPPALKGEPPESAAHAAIRERLAAGACFFTDLLVDLDLVPEELQESLWDLVWAGQVTNDAFAPLRAPRLTLARAQRQATAGRRFVRRRAGAAAQVQGRWSLTASLFPEADPSARRRALAELLLERYGVLTREQVLAEGVAGGFSAIYPELSQLETLGIARRGYFVEGLGGAQFALPGAVERLRALPDEGAAPLVLAAVDPAQPYGAVLPWPERGRATRVPGAYVVLVGAEPVLYLERGGRSLQTLVELDDARLEPALSALVDEVRAGRIRRLGLEKLNGEPAMSSPLAAALAAHGFQEGPRRLTLSA
jgi:ATP-dependent Lhr-like helicase